MRSHKRRVTWNHEGILPPVGGVSREARVPWCGEIGVVRADLVPDFLSVAWRFVAVEVTEVTVDFIQVPLLRMEVRCARGGQGDGKGQGEKR